MRVDVELSAASNTIVVVVVARPGRAVVVEHGDRAEELEGVRGRLRTC
jgi:hypothetical protein